MSKVLADAVKHHEKEEIHWPDTHAVQKGKGEGVYVKLNKEGYCEGDIGWYGKGIGQGALHELHSNKAPYKRRRLERPDKEAKQEDEKEQIFEESRKHPSAMDLIDSIPGKNPLTGPQSSEHASIVYIGDHLHGDVIPAHRYCGWHTVAVVGEQTALFLTFLWGAMLNSNFGLSSLFMVWQRSLNVRFPLMNV